MNKTGFTLIEVLVVVLIVGILAAFAVPWYQSSVEQARVATMIPAFKAIIEAQNRFKLETGVASVNIDVFDLSVDYKEKKEEGNKDREKVRYYYAPAGSFALTEGTIFWNSGRGYIIDYYGKSSSNQNMNATAICYASAGNSLGQRVCEGFGRKTERVSSNGMPVYAVEF